MNYQFSIGEMSKIHDVPIGTLRYYEEIGLFRPSKVNHDSGYRYYSADQFERLNTINYLKALGLSLKSIKSHLESSDELHLLQLLKAQQAVNNQKIERMILMNSRFEKRIQEIEEAMQVKEVGQVFIKRLPSRRILCIKQKISNRPELEILLKELESKSFKPSSIFVGMVGLTVSKSSLENRILGKHDAIFILPEENVDQNPYVVVIEEGEYACIYYREAFCKSIPFYHQLIDYIIANNYDIIGDAMERVIIDNLVSNNQGKHLSEIQIPIKRR